MNIQLCKRSGVQEWKNPLIGGYNRTEQPKLRLRKERMGKVRKLKTEILDTIQQDRFYTLTTQILTEMMDTPRLTLNKGMEIHRGIYYTNYRCQIQKPKQKELAEQKTQRFGLKSQKEASSVSFMRPTTTFELAPNHQSRTAATTDLRFYF